MGGLQATVIPFEIEKLNWYIQKSVCVVVSQPMPLQTLNFHCPFVVKIGERSVINHNFNRFRCFFCHENGEEIDFSRFSEFLDLKITFVNEQTFVRDYS